MSVAVADLLTAGDVSRRLGVKLTQVRWLLANRNIVPVARVANVRLYDESVVGRIREELLAIERQRRARGAPDV